MGKFKRYGNNKGLVLLIDEEKLDLNIVEQLRNYLDAKEKELKTINIAGEELIKQELRNAVYSGSWFSDAKRYFSKDSRPANGTFGFCRHTSQRRKTKRAVF